MAQHVTAPPGIPPFRKSLAARVRGWKDDASGVEQRLRDLEAVTRAHRRRWVMVGTGFLIGVLGWLDMPLRYWLYPVLTTLLLASFYASFPLDSKTRHRVIAISAATTVGYILGIFFIFYLVWTGLDETKVEGVQGRYFVVLLPVIATMVASSVKRGFSGATQASIAISSAILSGWATLDAISRSDWKFSLLPF